MASKNKRSKNFYFTIIELIQSGFSLSQISKRLGISKQLLNYYLKPLKMHDIIIKKGYGVWAINYNKLDTLKHILNNIKEVKKTPMVANQHPPLHSNKKPTLQSKDKDIRGHGFVFTLKLPKIKNWDKRLKYLIANNIPHKDFGYYQRIDLDYRGTIYKVWLCDKSIVVYFPKNKSFFTSSAYDSYLLAVHTFKNIINRLENLLKINLKFENNYLFKVSRHHYSHIKNALAKHYHKLNKKLYLSDVDGLWLVIDNSFNLHELETVHPQTSREDMDKSIKPFFNDLRHNPIKPSEIILSINQINQTLKEIKDYISEQTTINKTIYENLRIALIRSIDPVKELIKKIEKPDDLHKYKPILEQLDDEDLERFGRWYFTKFGKNL